MLKADLHIHTNEDLYDSHIKYNAKELLDYASELGYEIIAITNHNTITYNKELAEYARNKGILLIPGVEKTIKGKHVLIYNISQQQADRIKTFEDLKTIKNSNNLIVAAHPYFKIHAVGKNLLRYVDFFDAIEYASIYTRLINFNKKAVKIANKYNKPLVGNSDLHNLFLLDSTYSLIDSKKDKDSVIKAIKNNKVELKSKEISHFVFFKKFLSSLACPFRRFLYLIK